MEILEGILLSAALSVLLVAGPRLIRFRVHFSLPKSARSALLAASAVSAAAIFILLVAYLSTVTAYIADDNDVQARLRFTEVVRFPGPIALPEFITIVSAATVVGLTVSRLDRGLSAALKWSLCVFALPLAVCLTLGLFLFDRGQMFLHVTDFASWSFGGVPLLSNWSVLVASSSLLGVLVAEALLRSRLSGAKRVTDASPSR